jgi:D-hydroxyproline dehydrogenase subunit beta
MTRASWPAAPRPDRTAGSLSDRTATPRPSRTTAPRPGRTTARRPRRFVVVGAGMLGACVAARLAEAGAEVTLLEQAEPGHAASRWSFAWLNSNDKGPRAYHDLNHAGMRAWAELAAAPGATAGPGGVAWYQPVGNLEWAVDAPGWEMLAARMRRLAGWGYQARLIGAAEAAELEPSLRLPRSVAQVAWFPDEGYLLTGPLVTHQVRRAIRHGATLLTGPPGRVTGLEAGAVRTAAGEVISADAVVCCAGRWVPELAALADAACPVPLVPWAAPGAEAPGLVVRAGPVTPPGPARVMHAPEVYLRPHAGGMVQLEAPDAAVDLHTDDAALGRWADELLRRARRVVRGLDRAGVADYRVCVRPMPADGRSIVGPLPGADGLYMAVTHSGVTLAAHLAGLITSELIGGTEADELAAYRPGRFLAGASAAGR